MSENSASADAGPSEPTPPGEHEWLDVAAADEIAVRAARVVTVRGRPLALIRLRAGPNGWRCIENTCPHRGAGLANGDFLADEEIVICPWHAWPFSLRDGRSNDSSYWHVAVFAVRETDGRVSVRVPLSWDGVSPEPLTV